MKFGIRMPSLKKSFAARTSVKRFVRHNLGVKAPRGFGWLTNPKKALYNRVYNRTTFSVGDLFRTARRAHSVSAGAMLRPRGETVAQASASAPSSPADPAIAACVILILVVSVVAVLAFGAVAFVPAAGVVALPATIILARRHRAAEQAREMAHAEAIAEWQRAQAEALADQQRQHEALRAQRWQWLVSEFGEQAAHEISWGRIWVGATAAMVVAALGQPAAVDERVLKTKTKHVYKYFPAGRNRFALKVKLDNGVVVGWDGPVPGDRR